MMINVETKDIEKKEIADAKKFVNKLGFKFSDKPRHFPSIKLVEGKVFNVINPITFEIGDRKLIELVKSIKSLGWSGTQIIKAFVDSYKYLTEAEQSDIRTKGFVESYTHLDMLQFFWDVFSSQLEKQHIKVESSITKKTTRNIWYSLGGYRGIKASFVDAWDRTLLEFKRVKESEDQYSDNKKPELKAPSAYTEFNPCITCKGCKIDRYGSRICKKYVLSLPEHLTVKEVNMIFPEASIDDSGKLNSHFIVCNVHKCEFYKERIGSKTK